MINPCIASSDCSNTNNCSLSSYLISASRTTIGVCSVSLFLACQQNMSAKLEMEIAIFTEVTKPHITLLSADSDGEHVQDNLNLLISFLGRLWWTLALLICKLPKVFAHNTLTSKHAMRKRAACFYTRGIVLCNWRSALINGEIG